MRARAPCRSPFGPGRRLPLRVRVSVPATSANCGPGFDTLGIALTLYNEVELSSADRLTVAIQGEGADRLPRDARNIVVRGAQLVHEVTGCPFRGLHVQQRNHIPPSRGLGSSASAWLGGILGANTLLGSPLPAERLMDLAVGREGHADNVGAALHGGLAVTCWDPDARAVVSLPVPSGLRFPVLIPDQPASTAKARAALPPSYPRADAVFNVGRAALLLAALARGRWELLGAAMADRLHQPYRARTLFPWLEQVFAAARAAGALGVALSGAGPAVLAVTAEDAAEAVARAMHEAAAGRGLGSRAMVLGVDSEGARTEQFSD